MVIVLRGTTFIYITVRSRLKVLIKLFRIKTFLVEAVQDQFANSPSVQPTDPLQNTVWCEGKRGDHAE